MLYHHKDSQLPLIYSSFLKCVSVIPNNAPSFQTNDISFDLSAGGLMSGGLYANPTAQSTPVGASKRGGGGGGHAPAPHSMLTTPNNSMLSLNNADTDADLKHVSQLHSNHQSTPSKSRYSPTRHYSSRLSDAPRTPTPFKKALADVFNRGEPISNTVSALFLDFGCFIDCNFKEINTGMLREFNGAGFFFFFCPKTTQIHLNKMPR